VITNIDASGQTNSFDYNQYGQLLTNTNAKGEKTINVYSNSYLVATIDATGTTNMTYTYDLFGRVQTATDSEGYTVTTDYDNADRPRWYTYPDGTYRQIVYQNLDEAASAGSAGPLDAEVLRSVAAGHGGDRSAVAHNSIPVLHLRSIGEPDRSAAAYDLVVA
jgi:YD repeat-containing protein